MWWGDVTHLADLGMIYYEYCYIQTDRCLLTRPLVTLLLMQRVVLLFKAGVLIFILIQLHIPSVVFIAFAPIIIAFVHHLYTFTVVFK